MFSISFEKPRVRASVLARQHPPEPLIIRVAGLFAWQTAWQRRGRDNPSRVQSFKIL